MVMPALLGAYLLAPGSQTGLLPSSPLRTTRASFPACRSSLSNAPCGTRLCHVERLAMDLPMTVRMQEHPIVRRIAATVGSPDGVMVMPSRQSGHFLVTNRAETVLLFPEVQQLPSSFEIVCHLHAQAFLEVHFPLGGIRIGRASDLHMPLNRHVSCSKEFQFVVCLLPEENPMSSVPGAEVLLRHPAFGLCWMPSFGPRPQPREDGGVHVVEGDFARHMAVIVGPAPDHRIELGYQIGRSGLFVRLHDFPDFPQECFDILLGWFDEELASVLPYVLS